jgi:hypothetical protein
LKPLTYYVIHKLHRIQPSRKGEQPLSWSRISSPFTETEGVLLCLKEPANGLQHGVHKRIISAVRRVEFVSDRMSYIILRGRWCNIIVVNVHAPCEDTSNDIMDSFYEELGRVFDQFPRYDMKILLGDFNAKVGREDIVTFS